MQVIADGLVIESFGLVIDEASLTGESDPMHKGPKDPWCRSGTQVRAAQPRNMHHVVIGDVAGEFRPERPGHNEQLPRCPSQQLHESST